MSTIEHGTTTGTDDAAAIDELHEIVERQRAAFLADPFPSLDERQALLGALAGMVMTHRTQIEEAMSADFGVHPTLATDLIEVLGVAGPRGVRGGAPRGVDGARAALLGPRAVRHGPRVRAAPAQGRRRATSVPWNFPFDLSVGPLVEMLAAGNRVVMKPSEHTPACAEVLRDMIRATFDRDRVDVVVGGLELAKAFTPRALGPPALHGQPGDRARDREGGGRAARAGDARAGRQVPGDPHRRLDRRRVGQAGARHQGAQERADVHLGRLLPRAARAHGGLRPSGRRARAREHARLLHVGEQHRHHHDPPPRADPEPARGRPGARLRRAAARGGRRGRSRTRASCRCRSCSTRPTTSRSCRRRSSARSCRSRPTTSSTRRSGT